MEGKEEIKTLEAEKAAEENLVKAFCEIYKEANRILKRR